MGWKLVESDDDDAISDDELASVSVYLAHSGSDVALSAWSKVQPMVTVAMSRTYGEAG